MSLENRQSNILDIGSDFRIRIDSLTQQGSVFDVIKTISQKPDGNCRQAFSRLGCGTKEHCTKLKINGKGKATWVAAAPTLVQIIWELPGKAAKEFRRLCAGYICRVLGGDQTLISEITDRAQSVSQEQASFFLFNQPMQLPVVNVKPKSIVAKKRRPEDKLRCEYEKKRKSATRDWLLTFDEWCRLTSMPCFYCGKSAKRCGLDRSDNNQNYHISNVVSCCWPCNRAKNIRSMKEYVRHCVSVARHSGHILKKDASKKGP